MDSTKLKKIIEGALLAAGAPLSIAKLAALFEPREGGELEFETDEKPSKEEIRAALEDIQADTRERGFELKEVGSGWRFQVVQEVAPWIGKLWEEKPQRYSRALLETLALIAYRQPITRGEIESIRGVAVSTNIIKTLTEREWVKVVGHRDVPGRPALYATTKEFLDYFNLSSLEQLPSLKEIKEIDKIESELDLEPADDADKQSAEGTSETEAQQELETGETNAEADDPESAESAPSGQTESHRANSEPADEEDESEQPASENHSNVVAFEKS